MLPHLRAAFQESINDKVKEWESPLKSSDTRFIGAYKEATHWVMSYSASRKSVMLSYNNAGKDIVAAREQDSKQKKGRYPEVLAVLRQAKGLGGASVSSIEPTDEAKKLMTVAKPHILQQALEHPNDPQMTLQALVLIDAMIKLQKAKTGATTAAAPT
jgi:hypothetical protein